MFILSSLLEALLPLLLTFLSSGSLRVPKLRIVLEAVEVIMHVPVEERGMHSLGESIYKHVVCRYPPDAVFEVLYPFTHV